MAGAARHGLHAEAGQMLVGVQCMPHRSHPPSPVMQWGPKWGVQCLSFTTLCLAFTKRDYVEACPEPR
jgi:hypothetical protein